MHIRKYNRAFDAGTSVTKERASITRADTTAVSKQTCSRSGAGFFSATRGYTAAGACMQRQYFECIMNTAAARALRERTSPRFGLSNAAKVYFHILHSRNSHLQQQFSSTCSATRRGCVLLVCVQRRNGDRPAL